MSFFRIREETKSLLKVPKQKVYCQTCGYNLTNIGALITDYGEAYCHDVVQCLEKGLFSRDIFSFASDFFNPKEMQEGIREGKLVYFGKTSRTEELPLND